MSAKSAAEVVWRGREGAPADDRPARPIAPTPAARALGGAPTHRLTRRRLLLAGLQLIVLAVSAGVIYALLRKVDPASVISKAGNVSWILAGAAIALNLPTTLLRARRSQILLDRLGHHVPFVRMNWVDLAGQTLSWLTPAASGDLSRPYLWRNQDQVPISAGLATVLYERLVTLVQMAVVGGLLAAVIFLPPLAVAALAAASLVVLALPWWASLLTRGTRPEQVPTGRGLRSGLLRALLQLHDLGASARLTAAFTAYTLVIFAISGFQILLLAWAVGAGPAVTVAVAAYCISQVAGSISTLPFGLGAADLVTIGLLTAGGVGHPAALVITVLVRLVMTLPLGIAGAIGILLLGRPRISDEAGVAAPVRT
ncbi:MAG: lysylphosphatidylglycerol synthase transmembrane domain-containing protein [Candidatus Dormibacteria bacterium]